VSSDPAAELEALERQGWEALSGPSGAAFYEELMADDGLMVFPGLVLDKRDTLRAIAGERPWARFELSDVRVTRATPDAALVTYRAVSQRGEEAEYRALMTTVYARRDGRWRLVLHQQTPLPGGS
jgi:uncharacterized protein (TIGR02246 family)